MKLNLRILLLFALAVASVGIGTLGVRASTDCQHLFRGYQEQVEKHLHHKVSPETLVRWAAWNKAHPHYHPTKQESIDKIDFVCQVPMDDAGIADTLTPVDLPPMIPAMTDTFTAPAPPNVVVSNLVPPDNPEQSSTADPIFPPVYYPGPPALFTGSTPPVPALTPTPEPPSLLLMATACGLMSALVCRNRDRARA